MEWVGSDMHSVPGGAGPSSDLHPNCTPPHPGALARWSLALCAYPQLFKGKFYHCLGVDTRNITNRSDCVAANYRWVHHKYNFDNLGQVSTPSCS